MLLEHAVNVIRIKLDKNRLLTMSACRLRTRESHQVIGRETLIRELGDEVAEWGTWWGNVIVSCRQACRRRVPSSQLHVPTLASKLQNKRFDQWPGYSSDKLDRKGRRSDTHCNNRVSRSDGQDVGTRHHAGAHLLHRSLYVVYNVEPSHRVLVRVSSLLPGEAGGVIQ